MSDIVAPVPTGFGVTAIGEHRPQRDGNAPHRQDEEHAAEDRHPDEGASRRQPRHGTPPPPVEDPPVPAETLFATTIFANQLMRQPPSPEELRLRNGQAWSPPDSSLRLKDKLI